MNEKKAYDGIYNRYIKRWIDVLISGVLICLFSPIYLLVALVILSDDGPPVIYRAERGGYLGKNFRICKFRSMVKDADKLGGGTTALHDTRITRTGKFLRRTKLDELPQLWLVFLGKMSLVGPRPELMYYVDQYSGEELDILKVRPGITDYSSILYINLDEFVGDENADENYEKYVLKNKNALRVKYARSVSFKTDAEILLKTVYAVLQNAYHFITKKNQR